MNFRKTALILLLVTSCFTLTKADQLEEFSQHFKEVTDNYSKIVLTDKKSKTFKAYLKTIGELERQAKKIPISQLEQ